MAKKITGSGWSRAEFLEAQGEMAGKPKITLSALKCDAFLNLKRQLASKDKELAKALQDNKMCAEHMNAQDAEIVKLEKENAALTARIAKAKEIANANFYSWGAKFPQVGLRPAQEILKALEG